MKNEYFELGSAKHNLLGKKIQDNNYDYNEKEYIFDPNKQNDSHTAIVRQIKEQSTVLDIGCASGIIGSILYKYKNCIVDGIEYDKTAYEVSKKKNVYRNVYNFSITDVESSDYKKFVSQKRKYDYIIFADVLEHLINPWDTIINVSKMLKKNGSIIISVPNISHLDIIKSLINGDFNYSRWGILDSTHLRFFTTKSFIQMILNIEKESDYKYDVELCERVLIKPPYFVDDQDYKLFNIDGNLEDYLTLQNIFKLTLVKEKHTKPKYINHDNYFEKMNNYFKKILDDNSNLTDSLNKQNDKILKLKEWNEKLEKDNTFLNNDINRLKNENEQLSKELNAIINSKRWKLINKILKK